MITSSQYPQFLKIELPKSDFDKNILVGLSGIKNMASIYADLYVSRKCTTR